MNRSVSLIVLIALCLLENRVGRSSEPQDNTGRTVQSRDAVAIAFENNPTLAAARLSVERAEQSVRSAEGLYPFVLDADTGYTHASSPLGGSQYQQSDAIGVGAGLSKTYALGTEARVRLDGEWYDAAPPSGLASESTAGEGRFAFGARLTVNQPIIRGFGTRVGLATLRQAGEEKQLSEKQANAQASALAQSVLSAYWELWLAAKFVEINKQSKAVAEAQLVETIDRVNLGEAAPVDILSYRTRLASLSEIVLESEAELRRRQIRLAADIGVIATSPRILPDTGEPLPTVETVPDLGALVRQALTESPDIAAVFASVSLAKERTKIAGESLRQRLDLTGWIEARTAAYEAMSPLVTDLENSGAYAGYIGLTYELPLDNRRKEGEQAKALLDVDIAVKQLKSAEDRLRADVAVAREDLITAKERSLMAEETLSLAKKQLEAEQERYRLGSSIFTAVRDAEETVREAELRLTQAKVDVVQSKIALEHLTGKFSRTFFRL